MRLIDAEELLKAIATSGLIWETTECLDVIETLAVKKIIDDAPTIEERPKGEWITKHHVHGVTYCSECDFELKIDDTNFCPNCGARMER